MAHPTSNRATWVSTKKHMAGKGERDAIHARKANTTEKSELEKQPVHFSPLISYTHIFDKHLGAAET
jgi:hypothetical protein